MTTEQIDTLVIGGGQAGLSVGYYLKRLGRPFLILEANQRIGDSWRGGGIRFDFSRRRNSTASSACRFRRRPLVSHEGRDGRLPRGATRRGSTSRSERA